MNKIVNIVGGGLAGCECAYFLAEHDIKVNLYESKPLVKSDAHKTNTLAEIVCSNSLKNTDPLTSSGLLKAELRELGSLILRVAQSCSVPSGSALAVDRNEFTLKVDSIIKNHKNITLINELVQEIDFNSDQIWVIATGPLTHKNLLDNLQKKLNTSNLHFFDASAPIVLADSLDYTKCFIQDRYSDIDVGDYINCIMTKDEYLNFYNELINAETVELKDFENSEVFEGCMPIEVMAKRGVDSLRFGPCKPAGLNKNKFGVKPYAVVQLRKENMQESAYNIVGFQTNLKFKEQKRVFSMIPALKNAEFIKYGVMHKNAYINAPMLLSKSLNLKQYPNIYFAGQLSGVEGYVESTASGMMVAISILLRYNNKVFMPTNKTMMGSLACYITNSANSTNFQPMNSNYGIIQLPEGKFKDKLLKKQYIYDLSIKTIKEFKEANKWI